MKSPKSGADASQVGRSPAVVRADAPQSRAAMEHNGSATEADSRNNVAPLNGALEHQATPAVSGTAASEGEAGPVKKKRRRRRRRRRAHVRVPLEGAVGDNQASAQTRQNGAEAVQRGSTNSRADGAHWKQSVGESSKNAPNGDGRARKNHHRRSRNNVYAALDLGTNNCRLLVAVPTRPGQFRVIDAFSRIVRLGEGLGHSNSLSQAAMDRAIEALVACRDKLERRPMRRTRLIATEACRSANNGAEFLHRVHEETGLKLDVVDRKTEAHLAVSGCSSLVSRDTDAMVLFDIGGGSSEIALLDLSRRKSRRIADHIVAWTSLPVGVVTLAERFGGRDVTPEVFAAMKAYSSELLHEFAERDALRSFVGQDGFHLLGTSGTVTTLAGIHLDLPRYDRRRVDGLWLNDEDVTRINDRLVSLSFEERVANPCIGADRADLVLAGCAILDAIRDLWPSRRLRVADRGLREGLLTEMMFADGAWRRNRGGSRNRPPQGGSA